jgi:hypothetical protein
VIEEEKMLCFAYPKQKVNSGFCYLILVFLTLITININIQFIAKGSLLLVFAVFIFTDIVSKQIYYKDKGMKAINY